MTFLRHSEERSTSGSTQAREGVGGKFVSIGSRPPPRAKRRKLLALRTDAFSAPVIVYQNGENLIRWLPWGIDLPAAYLPSPTDTAHTAVGMRVRTEGCADFRIDLRMVIN